MKRSRQVLVISIAVLVFALLIVASLATNPPGQREITKTTAETVLKTETQLTTPTKITTEELKTVTSYSTIPTTIPKTEAKTTTTTESTKELTTESKTEVKTTTVAETTKELTTELNEPWKSAALAVFVVRPREVEEPGYVQHIIELRKKVNPNDANATPPSGFEDYTDEYGNNFTIIYWNKEPKNKVVISFEAIVSREENPYIIPETSPHPYPLEHLIPENIKQYLKPLPSELEPFYYNTDLIALAKELAQGFNDEAAVVNATLNWVGANIKYDHNEKIRKQHPGPWTPIETLKYKAGREEAITDLTLVLLTIQGIPARRVFSFGYPWLQVFYPKAASWVNYDPTAWAATQDPQSKFWLLPRHIECFLVSRRIVATGSALHTIDLEDKCYIEGIFRVQIRRILTIVPKP